jgi:hypothetical protein
MSRLIVSLATPASVSHVAKLRRVACAVACAVMACPLVGVGQSRQDEIGPE